MNRNLSAILFLILLSLFASCSPAGTERAANSSNASPNANAQATPTKALPEDVVQASASRVEVQAGKPAQATIRLVIKDGYHINGNPASQYQIATQLTVEPSEGISAAPPTYPPSITKKFEFSEQPIAVYEKEAIINLPLSATAAAARGERIVPARLRFQACDDQVCYPPKNLRVSIPALVK